MSHDYVVPSAEYIVDVHKIDSIGFHGMYKLIGDKAKYGYGCFRWEEIFSMEKVK